MLSSSALAAAQPTFFELAMVSQVAAALRPTAAYLLQVG
jgi:hypothetical protein